MSAQRFWFQEIRQNAGVGSVQNKGSRSGRFLFYSTIFGVAFCISLLYQAMRPIMRLGGMVASGGPYAIEHPAPSWVWIMPAAIMVGMACFFINLFSGPDMDGVNLMPLAWPGLFLSLGWNFLEFAFIPTGVGFAWGWLVCGVMFVLMGGMPLVFFLKKMWVKIRIRIQNGEVLRPYAVQGLLAVAGIIAAIYAFRAMVGVEA